MNAGAYYEEKVENSRLVKGGVLQDAGVVAGSTIALFLYILLLSFGLLGLTKLFSKLFMHNVTKELHYALKVNDYVAIVIGMLITIGVGFVF